ncbi:MAG TPA: hypothetical protein VET48_11515 [Steroidobacteraceae bacterium]|nr:hypothetical protein [Steroidobacteraceae bacterium]
MTVLPAMAFAAAMVYWLSHYISRWFSTNVTSLIDLILFVTIFVATNSFLKNLKGR